MTASLPEKAGRIATGDLNTDRSIDNVRLTLNSIRDAVQAALVDIDERLAAAGTGSVEIVVQPQASAEVAIEEALNQFTVGSRGQLRLISGTYALSRPIIYPSGLSNLIIQGAGILTVIKPDFVPSSALADDPTNFLISFAGAPLGSSTTTTARIFRGTTINIPVSSSGIVVAGDTIEIASFNGTDESAVSQGSSVANREIATVESVPDGTHITLTTPVRVHHKSGATVRRVTSVSAITIQDLMIDGTGHNIAVGLSFGYARNINISGITVKGFSRGAIALVDCTEGVRIRDIHSLGEVNSIVFIDAAHEWDIGNITSVADGLRVHALGIPRGLISCQNDPSDGSVHDVHLQHGSQAILFKHGHHLLLANSSFRDFDPRPAWDAQFAAGERGNFIGVVETGCEIIGNEQFLQAVTFNNVTVTDCITDGHPVGGAAAHCYYWHDVQGLSICNNIHAVNNGGATFLGGFHSGDTRGWIQNVVSVGYGPGFRLKGVYVACIRNINAAGQSGSGDVMTVPLNIQLQDPPEIFDGVFLAGFNEGIRLPGGAAPIGLRIKNINLAGRQYEEIMLGLNHSGGSVSTLGQSMEIENTSTPVVAGLLQFKTPGTTGTHYRVCVVVNAVIDPSANGDVMFIAVLPQRCQALLDATAGVPGTLIEQTSSARLTCNDGTSHPCGKLIDYHSAAAEVKWIGPW